MLVLLGRRGWAGSAWWGHLLAGAGGGESVGLGAGVDDVGVEGEPVDDGGGQSGVGEGVAPLAERGVRSAGDGGSFLAGGDDLEEQLGPAGVEVDVADLVQAQQVWTVPGLVESGESLRFPLK